MNSTIDSGAAGVHAGIASAGAMMREAREAQGLEIEALAALIKVTPRKLELLEADRFGELPDATFARALAQTVCRALKADPAPVLRLLPPSGGYRIEQVDEGLNTPFRERPGHFVPHDWAVLGSPRLWILLIFVVAVLVAVFLLPSGLLGVSTTPRRAATASTAEAAPPSTVTTIIAAAPQAASGGADSTTPTTPADSSSGTAVSPATRSTVQLQAIAESWVEVTDARGQVLLGRALQRGESVGLDGALPLRVRIGNAAAVQLSFRGEPLSLAAYTRDNVARLELK